jgi:hypothetical protein
MQLSNLAFTLQALMGVVPALRLCRVQDAHTLRAQA